MFTDVVMEVSVVTEEGEGCLATGHVTAPSAAAPPVVSMRNCTVWGKNRTNNKPPKNPTKQNPTDVWKVSSSWFCPSLGAEAWEDNPPHQTATSLHVSSLHKRRLPKTHKLKEERTVH